MITHIEAIPVRVRRSRAFLPKTAHGEVRSSEYVIIKLKTSSGIVGLGEVTCSPMWNGEDAGTSARLVAGTLSQAMEGLDPADWRKVSSAFDESVGADRPFLRASIEMACLDAAGQESGVPVVRLLGGTPDQAIKTKIVLPAREPSRVAAMAVRAIELGAQCLKVKVGFDPRDDIERVEAVRSAVGADTLITIDANEGWSAKAATATIPILLDLGVTAFEQPINRSLLKESADLRLHSGATLVADESVWTWSDLHACIAAEAFDYVSLYPGKCGGLRRTVAMAEAADAAGLGVTMGSNLELGVGTAALAHTTAAARGITEVVPSDVVGPLYHESSLTKNDEHVFWAGARCPRGDGLGVELNDDALRDNSIEGAI